MPEKINIAKDRVLSAIQRLREKGALAVMGGSFFMKAAGFLGSIVLVRVMSKNDYGILAHVENIYNYAYIFAGLGLNYAVFRYIVLAPTQEEKRAILNYSLKAGFVINVIIIFIALLINSFLPDSNSFEATGALLPLMLIALPLHYSFETGQFTLRALFDNKRYALNAVLATVLIWLTKVVGALIFNIPGAVVAWPVAYACSASLTIYYVVKKRLNVRRIPPLERQHKDEMYRYSLQYMITNGLWALFMQNDLLIISSILDDASLVAEYKVAYAVPAALAILSSSVGIFVAPYFVKKERDHAWVWKNYLRVLFGTAFLVTLSSAIIALCSGYIVKIMYGEQYNGIIPLMNLLLIVAIINNGIRYPTANLFASMGVIHINLITAILGMVLQILLDFALIPMFGLYGAAYSSIIVYTFMSFGVIVPFVKKYRK